MCVDGGGFALAFLCMSIAAYNIAKLYFKSKEPRNGKTDFDRELYNRFGINVSELDIMLRARGK